MYGVKSNDSQKDKFIDMSHLWTKTQTYTGLVGTKQICVNFYWALVIPLLGGMSILLKWILKPPNSKNCNCFLTTIPMISCPVFSTKCYILTNFGGMCLCVTVMSWLWWFFQSYFMTQLRSSFIAWNSIEKYFQSTQSLC